MATFHPSIQPEGPVLPQRAEHVTERIVDGDLVLYDSNRQYVHALNPTAAFIWRACDGRRDEAAIAAGLAEYYPEHRQAIEQDVPEILRFFQSEGLLAA